jgi:AraC-like DNA-binding protein
MSSTSAANDRKVSLHAPPVVTTAERRPAASLTGCISRYAGYRIEGAQPGETRGLPSRHVTLMIGLGGTRFEITGARAFDSLIGGLHERPVLVGGPGGKAEGLHLFLTPLGTRSLLGVPASTLAGEVVDLAAIIGPRADELQNRLQDATAWSQRFDVLDAVLASLLEERRAARGLGWAWQRLVATAGRMRIGELAKEIGWSRRHLTQRFVDELGVTPKTLARILRFERACALVKFGRPPLAEVAAASGYSDQAHLTREWQALAGCTPKAWIAEQLPFVQDYELAGQDTVPHARFCAHRKLHS